MSADDVIDDNAIDTLPKTKNTSEKIINFENISEDNLGEIPYKIALGDNMTSVAGLFLREFKAVRKVKDPDNPKSYVQKNVLYYASLLNVLRTKEIKILTINYEDFTEWVNSFQGKISEILSKYGFKYPNIDISKITEQELRELSIYMYSKKLLEYLEGPKFYEFINQMKQASFAFLKEMYDIDPEKEGNQEFQELHVSVTNFPIEKEIHEINSKMQQRAVTVKGNLVSYDNQRRVETVKSCWKCLNCGEIFYMNGPTKPIKCRICNEKAGFDEQTEQNENKDYIYIKVQQRLNSDESQVGVTDLVVKVEGNHLISQFFKKMKPAANLKITGVVDLYQDKSSRNSHERLIQQKAIDIEVENENSQIQYNDRLMDVIANDIDRNYIEQHVQKMIRSMCPQLHGLELVKKAVLLQCVDAEPRIHGDAKTRVRGNINILLVGDSSMGKSEFGHFILKILPQSIRTVGGSSTTTKAALTTSVDIINGVRVVTFGVLALCDKRGIAIIDELDKRSKEDFEILSIPMDDAQQIPTHKSGFHQDVMARCPVLLIGNPSKNNGKWDPSKRIDEQTNFATWLTSRVDLIMVMTDDNDVKRKEKMLEHISKTRSRMIIEDEYEKDHKNKAYSEINIEKIERDLKSNRFEGIYDTEYLRHELHFLKQAYKPFIRPGSAAEKKLHKKWLEFSQISIPSLVGEDDNRPNPMMDARKINSLERLSMAMARLRRHHIVQEEDVEDAVELMTASMASLLPRKVDDESLKSKDDQFTQIVKFLNSERAGKIVDDINSVWLKQRDEIATGIRMQLTKFSKILFEVGFEKCIPCKGKKRIDNEICLHCEGNGVTRRPFSYYDFETPIINNRIMIEKECERWFKEYQKANLIIPKSGNINELGFKKVDSVDVTIFVERISNELANAEIIKMRKEQLGGVNPMSYEGLKPKKASEIQKK